MRTIRQLILTAAIAAAAPLLTLVICRVALSAELGAATKLEEQALAAEATAADLESQATSAIAHRDEQAAALAELQNRAARARAQAEQQLRELERLTAQLAAEQAAWTTQLATQTGQLEELEGQSTPLASQAEALRREMAELRQALEQAQAETAATAESTAVLRTVVAETAAVATALAADVETNAQELEDLARRARSALSLASGRTTKHERLVDALAALGGSSKTYRSPQFWDGTYEFPGGMSFVEDGRDRSRALGREFIGDVIGRAAAIEAAGAWRYTAIQMALHTFEGSVDSKGKKYAFAAEDVSIVAVSMDQRDALQRSVPRLSQE